MWTRISQLRDFTRSYGMTPVRLVKRGPNFKWSPVYNQLDPLNHINVWHVFPQFSCVGTSQIIMWQWLWWKLCQWLWKIVLKKIVVDDLLLSREHTIMTSSNGNIFRVTGPLCGEFTGDRWIPCTKACDAELWCFLWSALFRSLICAI